MLDRTRCSRNARLMAGVAMLGASLSLDAAERFWPPIVDPATGQHHPGRWVWADLVTADVAVAAGFYGKVFGWTYETYGGEDDEQTYTLVLADGLPVGGMVFDGRAIKESEPSARWVGFISVPDVATSASAVTQAGGQVVFGPKALGERGETAVFKDPDGTLFGTIHSRNGDPADYAGDLNEWYWLDLWTGDVARAATFYQAVAGYEILPVEGDAVRHGVHLKSGGFLRAGIMEKSTARESAVWLPYVRVDDARAATERARAAGGRVLIEPMDLGKVAVAVIADPTGAPVGIAQTLDEGVQP